MKTTSSTFHHHSVNGIIESLNEFEIGAENFTTFTAKPHTSVCKAKHTQHENIHSWAETSSEFLETNAAIQKECRMAGPMVLRRRTSETRIGLDMDVRIHTSNICVNGNWILIFRPNLMTIVENECPLFSVQMNVVAAWIVVVNYKYFHTTFHTLL